MQAGRNQGLDADDAMPVMSVMDEYLEEGRRKAFALGNRGPIRFDDAGRVHPEILEAYGRCGFYVFEGVLGPDELADIEHDIHHILDRVPVARGSVPGRIIQR